jgi:hypothetical protein
MSLCYAITGPVPAQTYRIHKEAVYPQFTTYSTWNADVFSFAANQASLASMKQFSAGIYSERRYMLEDLSTFQSALAMPTSGGSFGLMLNYLGNKGYNESQAGLAYARSIGDQVDIGVQFNYQQFKTSGYGSTSLVNMEAGLIGQITDRLRAGVHLYNLAERAISRTEGLSLPFIYSAGMGYDVSQQLYIGATLEKEENYPVTFCAGVHYSINEKVFARCGISTQNSTFFFGGGVLLNTLRVDATASIHPYLGVTPGLMITFHSNKKL